MKNATLMFPYRSLVLTMGLVPGVLSATLSTSAWTCRFVVVGDGILSESYFLVALFSLTAFFRAVFHTLLWPGAVPTHSFPHSHPP